MSLHFLQVLQTTPTDSVLVQPIASEGLLDTVMKGGWIMLILAILSVFIIAVFIERLLALSKAHRGTNSGLMDRVRSFIQAGDVRGAIGFCAAQNSSLSRILMSGLERLGRPINEIQESVQAAGRYEAFRLQRWTSSLASVAGIAPLLGFLGTVMGMIKAFRQIQSLQGNVNPSVLAGGIWEALITTAGGLVVGIAAFFFYNHLLTKVRSVRIDMERAATDFIDVLRQPA